MKRLVVLLTLTLGFLARPLAAEAQAAKAPRLGFLGISPAAASATRIEGLRQGLRELGYIEGQNIAIEWRYADSQADRLPGLAAELVRLNVDVIVAAGVEPTRAAKQATTTIPIVMGKVAIPLGSGSSPVWRDQGGTSPA